MVWVCISAGGLGEGGGLRTGKGKGKPSMSTVPVYNSTDNCFAHRKTLIHTLYLLKTVIIYHLIVMINTYLQWKKRRKQIIKEQLLCASYYNAGN